MTEVRYGDWIEEALLGEGAFAEVHRARHAASGQLAALKVLREEWRNRHQLRARFADEAETSRLIGQGATRIASLPAFLGADTDADVPWIAVEFVKGRALADVMEDGQLPNGRLIPRDREGRVAWAREVGIALCEALSYTHRRGIVHRDVKPENILASEDGRYVCIDFGIARDARGKRHTREDMPSPMTPEYAAPELLESRVDEHLEAALDTYAVGCTLYELITGTLPPVGSATTESGNRWMPRTQALDLGDRAPTEIRRLVLAATAHDAALRPAMGAMLAILKGAEIGGAILPPGGSMPPPPGGAGVAAMPADGVSGRASLTAPTLAAHETASPTLAAHEPASHTIMAEDTTGNVAAGVAAESAGASQAAAQPPQAPPAQASPPAAQAGSQMASPPPVAAHVPAQLYDDEPLPNTRSAVPWIPLLLVVAVLLFGIGVGIVVTGGSGESPPEAPVPAEVVEPDAPPPAEEPPVEEAPAEEPATVAKATSRPPARTPRVVTPPPEPKEEPPPEPKEEPKPEPKEEPKPEPKPPIEEFPATPSDFPPTSDQGFRDYALKTAKVGDRTAFQRLADYIAENPAEAKKVLTPKTAAEIVEASMSFDRLPYPKAGASDVVASYLPSLGDDLSCGEAKTWLRWTYGRRAGSASSSDFYKKWCRVCTAKHPPAEVANGGECMAMKDHTWVNGLCLHQDVELFPLECP